MFRKLLVASIALALAGGSASARGLTTKELEVRNICMKHGDAAVVAMGTKLTFDAADEPQYRDSIARNPNWKYSMIAKMSPLERAMLPHAMASNETVDAFMIHARKACFAMYGMPDTIENMDWEQESGNKGGLYAVTSPDQDLHWEHRDIQGESIRKYSQNRMATGILSLLNDAANYGARRWRTPRPPPVRRGRRSVC
jgi:hypothetical protein